MINYASLLSAAQSIMHENKQQSATGKFRVEQVICNRWMYYTIETHDGHACSHSDSSQQIEYKWKIE
eukprot:scaffold63700_cov20-Cyclotella_meneghiniana.AAC.1